MKAIVNAETCIGCELCIADCPEVFKMEDGKAVVIADPVPADKEDACRTAAENCAVTSIELK